MSCNKCGMCCKAIVYSKPKCELDILDISEYFIMKNWRRLSKKEAIRINPRLAMIDYRTYFYTCIFHKNNLCKIHNIRPSICSNYPNYMKIDKQMAYSENCGYFKK